MKKSEKKVPWSTFLIDVLICSLGAYGGPEAHFGVFTDQMVIKKKYLTEEELVELIALTGILPGPSSTQTIISIGHKIGGPKLAVLTMVIWALPVLIIMTALSFLSQFMEGINLSQDGLRFVGPMAVGFIIAAAYRISKKVIKDKITLGLFLLGAIMTYFFRNAWVFPLVLSMGGVVAIFSSPEKNLWNKVTVRPPWKYLIAFSVFAMGGLILNTITDNKIIDLFESFYRYGYLVIGGGQVVVPLMHTDLVEVNQYMTNREFLTGFGIVQGMPGPMFSFSSYAGGMAARGHGWFYQIVGAVAGGIGIFLPGILLIFFVYPIWEDLKKIKGIKVSLKGITAVAGGLITTSAIVLMISSGLFLENFLVMVLTVILLMSKKIPAPLIVMGVLILGFLW
jgi:chromate transporter